METTAYPVIGAGELHIGDVVTSCGKAVGVHVHCTWGGHGNAGGVMDLADMVKLRNDLTRWIAENAAKVESDREFYKSWWWKKATD